MRKSVGESDSRKVSGGRIPGSVGVPAFTLTGPEPSAIPVVIAVPHAGRGYTSELLNAMRSPGSAALKLEDRYVDRLAAAVAAATGAMLLVANAPRAMIDLNRAPDDVDWGMFGRAAGSDVGSYTPSRRARSGLGLIPRRLPGIGELWKRRHDEADLDERIAGIHEPYHAGLGEVLGELRERWGAALLIDLHSMPPIMLASGLASPQLVVGDRFGDTCHGSLVATAFTWFGEQDCAAAHNRPYAGGYVLERHSSPTGGIHAMQIEVDRSRYLDSGLAEPGAGFADVVSVLTGLVRKLAAEICALGRISGDSRWPEAAE
ncbi:MAG: N-formylglutamate amidohydrolase [Novosphingobium sp.]|nr:N-formylglutamate amidohydrolase [Novosphingobium sp.]